MLYLTVLCKGIIILFLQFCFDNKGYLAELETQDEDTGINDYLDCGSYYWIGLRRDIGKDGKQFSKHLPKTPTSSNHTGNNFVWDRSQKRAQYTIWWKRVWGGNIRAPNGPGKCVFKDSWKEPNGKWGWDLYGWTDYKCDLNTWSERYILALCELPKSNLNLLT